MKDEFRLIYRYALLYLYDINIGGNCLVIDKRSEEWFCKIQLSPNYDGFYRWMRK